MNDILQETIESELIILTTQLLLETGSTYKRDIKVDDSLQRHLGIDSLGRAELFKRIETKFNVALPDALLAEAESLEDIAKYLHQAKPEMKSAETRTIISSHGEASSVDPLQAQSLIDILTMYAERSPKKAHIYFQNEQGQEEIIEYGLLLQNSLRVAGALRERGLKEGETVAIMQPTQPGFFYTFLGILLAGGIPVPIYPPFRMHMLEAYAKTEARILSNAEVRILITFDKAETLSRMLQAFVPSLKMVTTLDSLLQSEPLTSFYHARMQDAAFIQYTSGSTNDPKGVLLSHGNLISNIRAYGKAIGVRSDDVGVSWLPLYHDMGLIAAWLGSLYYGVPLVLMTPFSFLNHPERWLWAMHYHRGSLSGAPNFAYELCINKISPAQIEGLDLSSWRVAANGAEKVYPRTLDQFAKKFAPYGFKRTALMPVYGLAESTVALTIPPRDREFLVDQINRQQFEAARQAIPATGEGTLEFASCGVPIEGHDVRIVDDENNELPERHVGRLQFMGPSSMQGYYNNPRATRAIRHNGWTDSGDLAYMANGEVYITGRRKDLIIKAGRNLYPAEIEELVGAIQGVRQGCVAAFGATDAKRGTEQLVVVAETREKNKTKREQIIANINGAIASTLDIVPDQVVLVAPHAVPKTSSGKLQRALCKARYLEGSLGRFNMPPWLQVTKLGVMWFMRQCFEGVKIAGRTIYTIYVALICLFVGVPTYLIVLISSSQFAAMLCRAAARLVVKLSGCPLRVVGQHHLSEKSPVIYAANHASFSDALFVAAVMPAGTRFVGKQELFKTPFIRTFMKKLNFLSVDRQDVAKGLEDAKLIEADLKAGYSVLIFPEGTFSYASGLRPFRLGAFKIAFETGVPICPVSLMGTRAVLRDTAKLLTPGRVKVTIGKPIMPVGKEWQDVIQLRQAVRMEISKHCGEPSLDYIATPAAVPKLAKS